MAASSDGQDLAQLRLVCPDIPPKVLSRDIAPCVAVTLSSGLGLGAQTAVYYVGPVPQSLSSVSAFCHSVMPASNMAAPSRSVASFSHVAAFHALLIYHMLAGIDELNMILAVYQPHSSRDALNLVAPYLRRCLAASVLGGHIGGTAQQQLLGGKQPFAGGAVLFLGQCFMLWCLMTGVLDPDFMPSVWTFFGLMGIALIWTTYIHMDELITRYGDRGMGRIMLPEGTAYFDMCDKVEAQSSTDKRVTLVAADAASLEKGTS